MWGYCIIMAFRLSELCELPTTWAQSAPKVQSTPKKHKDCKVGKKTLKRYKLVPKRLNEQLTFAQTRRIASEAYSETKYVFSESRREIVNTCKGVRTRNRIREHVREGGTVKNITCTRRFEGSRLTCVYKRKEF